MDSGWADTGWADTGTHLTDNEGTASSTTSPVSDPGIACGDLPLGQVALQ